MNTNKTKYAMLYLKEQMQNSEDEYDESPTLERWYKIKFYYNEYLSILKERIE